MKGKMRTWPAIVLLLCAIGEIAVAQVPCVTLPAPSENYAYNPPPATLDPNCTVTFPVALWIVRTDQGFTTLSDAAARDVLSRLNSDFASMNIQFEEYSLDYIDNTAWTANMSQSEFDDAATGVMQSNAILNILFVNDADFAGISYLGGRVMALDRDYITTSTATHEAGHLLSLDHTHGSPSSHSERVRRSGTGVNCDSEADGFCDTPAEPWDDGNGLLYLVDVNCGYSGGSSYLDDMSDAYSPSTVNYMSYSRGLCRDEFTTEQVSALRWHIGSNTGKRSMLTGITVAFDNQIDGNTAGGAIHVGTELGYSASFASLPHEETFSPCSMFEEYTEQDRLPVSAETHKHSIWNSDRSKYKMFQSVILPATAPQTVDQFAKFHEMFTLALGTHFEGGGTDLDFDFRDPWYVASGVYEQPDAYATKSTGFEPTGHYNEQDGGIMASIRYDAGHTTWPYYAMRVPWTLGSNKSPKDPTTIAQGDWVCYGMFPDVEGSIETQYAGQNWEYPNFQNYYTRSIVLDDLNPPASVTAEFQAHQTAINQTPPTRINSQRKVASESGARGGYTGLQHSVYESNGKIFYSKSTDDGAHWSPEELVSNYYRTAKCPSIAVSYHGWVDPSVGGGWPTNDAYTNVAYITFLEYNDATGNDEVVVKFKSTHAGLSEAWSEIDRISTYANSAPVIASPMPDNSALHYNEVSCCVLVWDDQDVLKYSIYVNDERYAYNYQPLVDGQSTMHRAITLATGRQYQASTVQPRYPSVSVRPFRYYDRDIFVGWNELGVAKMKSLGYDFQGQGSQWTTVTVNQTNQIRPPSPQAPIAGTEALSVSYHVSGPVFTYETSNPIISAPMPNPYPRPTALTSSRISIGGRYYSQVVLPYPIYTGPVVLPKSRFVSVCLQDYYSGAYSWPRWWSLVKSSTYQSTSCRPVVSSGHTIWSGSHDMVVGLNETTSSFYKANIETLGNRLTSLPGLDGVDPNANAVGDAVSCVYSLNAQYPFNYKIGSAQLLKTKVVEQPIMKQVVVRTDDSAFAQYGIVMPRICSSDGDCAVIDWATEPDTITEGIIPSIEDMSKTESFYVSEGDYLEYGVDMFAFAPDDFSNQFSIDVNYYDASSGNLLKNDKVLLTDLPTDSSMYLLYSPNISTLVGHDIYMTMGLSDTSEGMYAQLVRVGILDDLGVQKETQQRASSPTTLTLSQNYPNPFNPTTSISYSIPEASNIKISVADNLGRAVRTLVEKYADAGEYTVLFDAADLPTGTYYYSLTAVGQTITRQMTMIK